MSVFWFFIPGMNFFRPWQILKELFKGSDPSVEDNWQYNGDVHFSVHIWAVFYLVACIFNPITVPRIWFSDRENIGDIISTYKILIISDIILFLLGILAIIVVFKLHKLQEKKGAARVTDLARDLNLTKGSVSTALKNLKKKQLVREDEESKFATQMQS